MDKSEFKVRMVAPYFPDCPAEIVENWVKKTKEGRKKAQQGSETAIKTKKDFDEKIGKPVKNGIASFINPKFVSRSGRTYDDMMAKTDDSLAMARKDYPQRAKDGYETGKFEEKVERGQKEYARRWCEFTGPLRGYKKGGIKGLSALGVMAVYADPQLKHFLKERIDTIEGTPCSVIDPGKAINFKRILDNRIVHWGSEIINLGYEEQNIKRANQELNQLVNEYCREDIVPFSPGGASHIDCIVVEIPDPTNPNKKKKWLGLDIQVRIKD